MKRLLTLLFAAVLVAQLPGCAASEGGASSASPTMSGEGEPFTFTDDLGRAITVDDPQRVAVLMGSFAEVWLLAGGTLAAVTEDAFSERDLDLDDSVALVGTNKDPSLELLLAADPDLVILSANSAVQVAMEDSLEAAGMNLAYFGVNRFDEYLHMLDICTQITGRRDLYETNGLAVQEQIDQVRARAPGPGEGPTVLLLRTSASGVRAKNSEDTVTGQMLLDLGCRNIADSQTGLLEALTLESIIYQDPEYIFVIVQGSDIDAALEQLEATLTSSPAWSGLTAVREGNYHVLDKQLFQYKPNARWGESYQILADLLYGEADGEA